MELSSMFNTVFLCVLNALLMVVGIFLNVVVIVSMWTSIHLKKKLCYFTILVLSCFDLAVVFITHPILISSTILWSMEKYEAEFEFMRKQTSILLGGFSMFALLTLNIERFLALTCPFSHQSLVTKRKLTIFLSILITIEVALLPLYYYFKMNKIFNIFIAVFLTIALLIFIYMNYKMLVIAKLKRKDKRLAASKILPTYHQGKKKLKINLKNISTCSLAVGCFFSCSVPQLIYSIWRSTSWASLNDRNATLFSIWSNTFVCINSTLNCVIFFWRNSILRREGIKVLKRFRSTWYNEASKN